MKKAEFLKKLASVVNKYRAHRGRLFNKESAWAEAVSAGNAEGLGINPNKSVDEDKVLSAIMKIGANHFTSPDDVLLIQSYAEEAWEYFNERQGKSAPIDALEVGPGVQPC